MLLKSEILPLGKRVILDTNSHKKCCEADCTVTTCEPPLLMCTTTECVNCVYYSHEKNIRYMT